MFISGDCMRINVDFAFYVVEYRGINIDMEEQFPGIAMDAEQIVNKMTYGRIHRYELHEKDLEAVKYAICAVADILYNDIVAKQATGGRLAQRIDTDGESVTYAGIPSGMTEDDVLYQRCCTKARLYLEDTTLLYAGVLYDYE